MPTDRRGQLYDEDDQGQSPDGPTCGETQRNHNTATGQEPSCSIPIGLTIVIIPIQ